VMLGQQLQRSLRASPHDHQPGEDGEILRCAPAALATPAFHDFFHVTTIAVVEGRAASGMMTSSACSA